MLRLLAVAAIVLACTSARSDVAIDIGYLRVDVPLPPVLSNLDPVPDDLGIAGAVTGLDDNNTTGRFLGQKYDLIETRVAEGEDPLSAANRMFEQTPFLVLDAPAHVVTQVADLPAAQGAVLFNTSAGDSHLRDANCRANVLHTLPSDAMRTDALAQFFLKKRWNELVLITGVHASDQSYADALRASLTKFGLGLKGEKTWEFDSDMRRNAAQEVPLFTQDFGDYDALLIADEVHDFGRYVLYNTWEPRPIAGSEGLSAVTWSSVIEQWGAAQLQSRFEEAAGRKMMPQDYAAWAAVRALGEAVTRTNSDDPTVLRNFLLSDDFELAGFKGRPLTFRQWNGQLRQPIAIVHPRALVAQAPLEGFLHQTNELDTLGLDRPESNCEAFQ